MRIIILCHYNHALFLTKCDAIFEDFFHTTALQTFRILLYFNLLKRFAARRLQATIIRIFQFNNHADPVRRLDGDVTAAFPHLCIRLYQPAVLAAQKPQQHPMIEIFFHVPAHCGIPHTDEVPQVILHLPAGQFLTDRFDYGSAVEQLLDIAFCALIRFLKQSSDQIISAGIRPVGVLRLSVKISSVMRYFPSLTAVTLN